MRGSVFIIRYIYNKIYNTTNLTGVRVEGLGWVMSNLKQIYTTNLPGVRVEELGWVMSNVNEHL